MKNVLIIGASGDIGLKIAEERIKKGDQLILHYHSNHLILKELANNAGEQILQIIQADLSNQLGVKKFLSELVFSVDIIIFASGKADFGLFQDVTNKTLDEMLCLHVKAPLNITSRLLPGMIKKQHGKIIFITSIWGEHGASYEVLYSTVKGAQNSFVRALAKELVLSNISVHAVSPGFIDTKMNADLTNEEKTEIVDDIPLQRPGQPEEVAAAVNFLIDSPSKFMNGQILPVTGGWMS